MATIPLGPVRITDSWPIYANSITLWLFNIAMEAMAHRNR